MAAASDGIGFRLGGVVDRRTVEDRLARRDLPLALPTAPPSPATSATSAPMVPDGVELVPFTAIRRRTAEHLTHSLATAAHALLVTEVDYTTVERARGRAGLTYLPYVARAVIAAVRDFPHINATSTEAGLLVGRDVHLGIAVDLGFRGLVVPVVRRAGDLRLPALAARIEEQAARAHAGQLTADDLTGGTFTLTNVGRYGTVSAAPIINHPQVAILSTDGVRMRPVAVEVDDEWRLAIHPVGNLSLAFDHRAFDGAYAAAFLARVRDGLEQHDWEAER